jgi:hypothetical protein
LARLGWSKVSGVAKTLGIKEGWVAVAVDGVALADVDVEASALIQLERGKNETVLAAALHHRLQAWSEQSPGTDTPWLGEGAPKTSIAVVIDFVGPAPWAYKGDNNKDWCPFDLALGFKLEQLWVESEETELSLFKADTDATGFTYNYDLVKFQQHNVRAGGKVMKTREISRTNVALDTQRGDGWPSFFSAERRIDAESARFLLSASPAAEPNTEDVLEAVTPAPFADPTSTQDDDDEEALDIYDFSTEVLPPTAAVGVQGGVIGGEQGGVGLSLFAPPGALPAGTELSLARAPSEESGNVVNINISGETQSLLLPVTMRLGHAFMVNENRENGELQVVTRDSLSGSWVLVTSAVVSEKFADITLSPGAIPRQVAIRANDGSSVSAVALAFGMEEAIGQTSVAIWVIADREDSRLSVAQRIARLHPCGSWKLTAESMEPLPVICGQPITVAIEEEEAQEKDFKGSCVFDFQLKPVSQSGFTRVFVTGDKSYGSIDFCLPRLGTSLLPSEPPPANESPPVPVLLHRADGGVLTLLVREEDGEANDDDARAADAENTQPNTGDNRCIDIEAVAFGVRDCISKNGGLGLPEDPPECDPRWVVVCERTAASTVTIEGGFASFVRSRYSATTCPGMEAKYSPLLAVPPPGTEPSSSASSSAQVETFSVLDQRNEMLSLLAIETKSRWSDPDSNNCQLLLHRATTAVCLAWEHLDEGVSGKSSQGLLAVVKKVHSMLTACTGEGWLSRMVMPESGRAQAFASLDREIFEAAAKIVGSACPVGQEQETASGSLMADAHRPGGAWYGESLDSKLGFVRRHLCTTLLSFNQEEVLADHNIVAVIAGHLDLVFADVEKEVKSARFANALQRLRLSRSAFPLPAPLSGSPMPAVYVSYDCAINGSSITEFVTSVCRIASSIGFRPIVSGAGAALGGGVLGGIARGIAECSAFIAVLSPGYGNLMLSPWSARELEAADHALLPVLPVAFSAPAVPPPLELGTIATVHLDRSVDFQPALEQGVDSPLFSACAALLSSHLGGTYVAGASSDSVLNARVVDDAGPVNKAPNSRTLKDDPVEELEVWLASIRLSHALGPLRSLGVELLEDLEYIDDEDVRGLALRKVEFRRFDRARKELLQVSEGTSAEKKLSSSESQERPKAASRLDNALAGASPANLHSTPASSPSSPQWRAEVFGSMRFNSTGPARSGGEADLLSKALEKHGVKLHIIDVAAGASITLTVFETMERCSAFVVFGTRDYGERTGNPAATDCELAYWQGLMAHDLQQKKKKQQEADEAGAAVAAAAPAAGGKPSVAPDRQLIPVRMIPFDEGFDYIPARVLFGVNSLELQWPLGAALPEGLVVHVLKSLRLLGEATGVLDTG